MSPASKAAGAIYPFSGSKNLPLNDSKPTTERQQAYGLPLLVESKAFNNNSGFGGNYINNPNADYQNNSYNNNNYNNTNNYNNSYNNSNSYNRKVCPPPLRRRVPYIRSVGVKISH